MQVGGMGMLVVERFVPVRMRMRLGSLVAAMGVLMVLVVDVPVLVVDRLVDMAMGVLHADEEPGAGDHEQRAGGGPEARDLA
jgi:hypothetical protein